MTTAGTARIAVVLAGLLALAIGCAGDMQPTQRANDQQATAAVSPPTSPPVAHGSYADLVAAVAARTQADRTYESEAITRTTVPGQATFTSTQRAGVVLTGAGPESIRLVTQNEGPPGVAFVTELLVLPLDAFVRPDRKSWPAPQPPWIRLDPAGADQISQSMNPTVERLRRGGGGVGCLSDTGTTTIVRTGSENIDGIPVLRYDLNTRIDDTATDPDTARMLRERGLDTIGLSLFVDADDRARRCSYDVSFPDGASMRSDQRLVRYGHDLVLAEPPANEVLRLPS
jgi:hypothetical protein